MFAVTGPLVGNDSGTIILVVVCSLISGLGATGISALVHRRSDDQANQRFNAELRGRKDVPGLPDEESIIERIASVEKMLKPGTNGVRTLYDKVDSIEKVTAAAGLGAEHAAQAVTEAAMHAAMRVEAVAEAAARRLDDAAQAAATRLADAETKKTETERD
jgi:hypothetical protein